MQGNQRYFSERERERAETYEEGMVVKHIQKASDSKDAKTLYSLLNQIFSPNSYLVTPLKSKDTLL